MTRPILLIALAVAILLLSGNPSRIDAQGDTPIVVGDSSSLTVRPGGLDAGATWATPTAYEIRHGNASGMLRSLTITDGSTTKCAGTCGINTTQPWSVKVTYAGSALTVSSVSSNQGAHITQNLAPFSAWTRTANPDERVFHTGDGLHISGISVNGGGNLCSGSGACKLIATYR